MEDSFFITKLQSNPNNNEAYSDLLQYIDNLIEFNKYPIAEKYIAQALQCRPGNDSAIERLIYIADEYFINNYLEEATGCCKQILQHDPENEVSYDILYKSAKGYQKKGDFFDAANCFSMCLKDNKRQFHSEIYLNKIGVQCISENKLKEASFCFIPLLDVSEKETQYKAANSLAFISDKYLTNNDLVNAGKTAITILKWSEDKLNDQSAIIQNMNSQNVYNTACEGLVNQGSYVSKIKLDILHNQLLGSHNKGHQI